MDQLLQIRGKEAADGANAKGIRLGQFAGVNDEPAIAQLAVEEVEGELRVRR